MEQSSTLAWLAARLSSAGLRAELFNAPADLCVADFDGFAEKSHHAFDEDSLRSLLLTQQGGAKGCAMFVWCDDGCVLNSRSLRYMCLNGRHIALTIVLIAKGKECFDIFMRSNLDYEFTAWTRDTEQERHIASTVVLFTEGNAHIYMRSNIDCEQERRRMYKRYFSWMFSTFDKFDATMATVTQEFRQLVVNHTPSTGSELCFL